MIGEQGSTILQGGIIAAGQGSRLRADGYSVSKPMVRVAGRPLIDHALVRFRAAGIRRLTVIINDTSDDCRNWLDRNGGDFDLDLIVRTTPSSYASFQLVADRLAPAPAIVTTIDGVMPTADFCAFVKAAAGYPEGAMVLGLTGCSHDENPLWATLDAADGRIRKLGGGGGSHVTAGLYVFKGRRPTKPAKGFARLRDYLSWLVLAGHPVHGIVLPQVFDIDRRLDVEAAERASVGNESRSNRP